MNNTRRYTPEMMTELSEGEVFVFGSNTKGEHGGGAARIAHTKFDAEWGVGEGMTGRCYAIPTLDGNRDKVSREDFISSLAQFIRFANEHKNMTFFLTKVGCGIAGWDIDEVRTIFWQAMGLVFGNADTAQLPYNIIIPKEFYR